LAPTAGGKTEAAVFPVLSRMLGEDWCGLSTLYVCPIKALLNNLEPRLHSYASLVGRRVGIWHGDVSASARMRLLADPPDLLLTTPESIEVMLTSRRTDHRVLFRNVQAVVVDEMHAFAGDDRGWHLLAALERVARLAGREIQRIGLSATIGNAGDLLNWLSGSSSAPRAVIGGGGVTGAEASVETDVALDYVASLDNAARVIAGLHRGEKRLVFCDSRTSVERLAASLRSAGVTTFVSHSSLSVDERRQAERAFAEGREAVIVATSTLELGIDVGDLDRVIQINAPATVASFLQRLGRTGRRAGTARNCLFLATSEDAFLQAAGLLDLWSDGYVEPVVPPRDPYHIVAQQLMGLVLQEGGIARDNWMNWLGAMPKLAGLDTAEVQRVVEHMLATGILFEDGGVLSFGPEGEKSFGYRNFMDVLTVFTSPPLFSVLHGKVEIGKVHPMSFATRRDEPAVLLLGGRSWAVTHCDWKHQVAFVQPTQEKGRSQWLGSGSPLRFELCRAVRRVLARGQLGSLLTERGRDQLAEMAERFAWVDDESTAVVRGSDARLRWWTFAGLAANTELAGCLGSVAKSGARPHNFAVELEPSTTAEAFEAWRRGAASHHDEAASTVTDEALAGLKFRVCLPEDLARSVLARRMRDSAGVDTSLRESVRFVTDGVESFER
ncbi:MAG: DEAD/DEAH box helicase, partial [Myxococcales bacterium]|nr:DEAD/DEAH box helicase [Myxococcales bacterium]